MQTRKIILLIAFLIIFSLIYLFGCAPKSSELEKTAMELQAEIAEKEEVIKELQQKDVESNKEVTETVEEEITATTEEEAKESLSEDVKILNTIDAFINAVESKNYNEQKNYVVKYALDLVNLKEYFEKDTNTSIREVEKQQTKVDKIEGNKAEGFMSFTEHLESLISGDKYDLITEGKVYLEKINGEWKIVDYTRKNRLTSEALYVFEDFYKDLNQVKLSTNWVLFSLFDSTVSVGYTIENNNNFEISTSIYSSKIIGPDRKQNEYYYSGGGDLNEILPNAISEGDATYYWTNESSGDFKIFFGDIYNSDNYNDLITDLTIDIVLADALRY